MTFGRSEVVVQKKKSKQQINKKKIPSPNYALVGHERVNNIITG